MASTRRSQRLQSAAEAVSTVAQATKDLSPEAQVEAQRILGLPNQPTTDALWLIFVPALLALAALFGVFVYNLIRDANDATDPALLGQALTFVLGWPRASSSRFVQS